MEYLPSSMLVICVNGVLVIVENSVSPSWPCARLWLCAVPNSLLLLWPLFIRTIRMPFGSLKHPTTLPLSLLVNTFPTFIQFWPCGNLHTLWKNLSFVAQLRCLHLCFLLPFLPISISTTTVHTPPSAMNACWIETGVLAQVKQGSAQGACCCQSSNHQVDVTCNNSTKTSLMSLSIWTSCVFRLENNCRTLFCCHSIKRLGE